MTISNAAVEAAVKAWDRYWGDRYGDEALEEMGEEVRVALQAAAPIMLAAAWEAGAVAAWGRSTPTVNASNYQWRHEGEPLNPYSEGPTSAA